MIPSDLRDAPEGTARRLSPLQLVWLLGLTQTVGYGTLYYSFGVLSPRMAQEFGWPVTWVFAAFSAALLAGGLVAPYAGRTVDRIGAARAMVMGSLVGGLSMALAAAGGPVPFVAGLMLTQAASTFATYDAAFALITQVLGRDARSRITQLTLIAGFASSLFWPLTTWLGDVLGWRGTHLVYAAVNVLVLAPVHLLLVRLLPPWPRAVAVAPRPAPAPASPADERPPAMPDTGAIPQPLRRRAMILLAASFALGGFALSAILAQMVPLLERLGLGESAVLVSTLFGPSQVLIRFGTVLGGHRTGPLPTTAFALGMLMFAAGLLALTGASITGAVIFALALGFGSGLKSIVQGTLPLLLFGPHGYGATLGRLGAARLVLGALAPSVLALLIEALGPRAALLMMAATGLVALALLAEIARMMRPSQRG